VKWITRPTPGLKACDTAQDTLIGVELMHMIKKGRIKNKEGKESLTPAERLYVLAA
jgi:hypothetical protein